MRYLAVVSLLAPSLAAQQAADKASPPLPDGAGKEAVVAMCTKCHGTAILVKTRLSRTAWEDEVYAMVERGAEGTPEQIEAVIDYLAKNFSRTASRPAAETPSGVNLNKATAKELESSLEIPAKEAAAIVEHRDKNGNFRAWRDLEKVPGIDLKNLEKKKSQIVF